MQRQQITDDAAAVGLAAWPRVVSSLSLPCHTPPTAAAITTAPAAISQRTVRDITLPMVRLPPPLASRPLFAK